MTPQNILLGRVTLQTAATAKLIWDLNENQDDPISDSFDIIQYGFETAMIWNPLLKPAALGAGVRVAAGSTVVSTVIAPVAAGYMIGATVGTAASASIWGDEGAQTALGFYSGGLLPGTESPDLTDYKYIFKPTAPGGPVSLYDVAKKGFDNTVLLGRDILRKRFRRQ